MNWREADRVLLIQIDGRLRTVYERAGERMACRPGCADCCIGLFTINDLDARRLAAGLARLEKDEPLRAHAVVERAKVVVESVSSGFPGDSETGLLDPDTPDAEHFIERFCDVPCPALDPVSLRCELYSHRPLACRTYGPPVRLGSDDLPPCSLCFKGASAEEIERHRRDPDPDGLEHAILCELPGTGTPFGETIVAYALLASTEKEDD